MFKPGDGVTSAGHCITRSALSFYLIFIFFVVVFFLLNGNTCHCLVYFLIFSFTVSSCTLNKRISDEECETYDENVKHRGVKGYIKVLTQGLNVEFCIMQGEVNHTEFDKRN